MMTTIQERISTLSRKERVRRKLSSFLSALSQALGEPLTEEQMLPIESSDMLRTEQQRRVVASMKSTSPSEHILLGPDGAKLFDEMFERYANVSADKLLSLGRFREFPFVKTSACLKASHFYNLWKLGDTVTVSSLDQSVGMAADWYPDDAVQTFEIASWGIN